MDTKRPWGSVFVALVFLVFVSALIYVFWPNDERVVRGRLNDIASILSVPAERSGPAAH